MRRKVKVAALLLSHVVLFLIGAAAFAGYLTQAQFRTAQKDPLFRVGAALNQSRTDKVAGGSLDTDLPLLSRALREPSAGVIRLVALLELERLDDARLACSALAWPDCDPQTLTDMRKALRP
jgi:hypothetical protein